MAEENEQLAEGTPTERWECPGCGTPLNIAGLGVYAKVVCPECGQVEHVHTMLANFRIEGVLGVGGMSVVLRARDLVLDRPVAIKLLNEHYRDQPERIERFERECELMAKVRHENVVSVYSAGHVGKEFYIAMELLHGKNLEIMVHEEGPMAPAAALDVLRQAVKGLDAAHRAGLLHRDMKPGNIIIADDGHAKVLDFGLSLGTSDEDDEEIIWATPFYVPPETLKREPEDLRTDIYALGMTLRHLVTGREQFTRSASTEPPKTISQMLECKLNLPPMADMVSGLDEAYCDLIDHMTAFDPAERPASYASLLVEIDEVQGILAAQSGRTLRMRGRGILRYAAGVIGTLAVGAGLAFGVASLMEPEPERLFLHPGETLEWPERDALAAAMKQLQAGELEQARNGLAELADSEGEPTLCAWAALHARMIDRVLSGLVDTDFSERMGTRFAEHTVRRPASAGRALLDEMGAMTLSEGKPTTPALKACLEMERLRSSAVSCYDTGISQDLISARSALRGLGAAYAPVLERMAGIEDVLAANKPRRIERMYQKELIRLYLPSAMELLGQKMKSADASQHARIAVQKEACELLHEVVKLMQRRDLMPETGCEVSPDNLQSRLGGLNAGKLPEEAATLMLMAQGKFDEAAARNPYRGDEASKEAFAIIMRDWMKRVGK